MSEEPTYRLGELQLRIVEKIIDLMRRHGGATIADMTKATGWLPHTTRAAISVNKRKFGLSVERSKNADGRSVYSIPA